MGYYHEGGGNAPHLRVLQDEEMPVVTPAQALQVFENLERLGRLAGALLRSQKGDDVRKGANIIENLRREAHSCLPALLTAEVYRWEGELCEQFKQKLQAWMPVGITKDRALMAVMPLGGDVYQQVGKLFEGKK